jgi:hypothetical protein
VSKRISPLFTWRAALIEDPRLNASTRHVALTLSLYMSERGDSAFPSEATLAKDCARGKSTISAAITQLEECGWVHVKRAPGNAGGRGRTNIYRAVVPKTVPSTDVPENGPEAETVLSEPETVLVTDETVPSQNSNGPEAGRLPRHDHANTTPDHVALAPRSRPVDPVFEALYAVWLGKPYVAGEAGLTAMARGSLNVAVADLKQAGATPEEIAQFPDAWVALWAGNNKPTFTPAAAAKHYPALRAWIDRRYVARGSATDVDDLRRALEEASA